MKRDKIRWRFFFADDRELIWYAVDSCREIRDKFPRRRRWRRRLGDDIIVQNVRYHSRDDIYTSSAWPYFHICFFIFHLHTSSRWILFSVDASCWSPEFAHWFTDTSQQIKPLDHGRRLQTSNRPDIMFCTNKVHQRIMCHNTSRRTFGRISISFNRWPSYRGFTITKHRHCSTVFNVNYFIVLSLKSIYSREESSSTKSHNRLHPNAIS